MAIDLETGGHRRYAVYLHSMKYDSSQIIRDVTQNLLAHIASSLKPDIIAVDNLSEFPKIFGITPPSSTVVEVCRSSDGKYRSIGELAKEVDIQLLSHPNPSKTARLLAVLILKGYGSALEWSQSSRRILYHPLEWIDNKTKSVFEDATTKVFKKLTEKQISKPSDLLHVLRELKIIDDYFTIGKGKEAELFLSSIEGLGDVVIKIFYKFSSTTKGMNLAGLSSDDWRVPSILASVETRNLRFLQKNQIPVPEVYHRDGPLVIMEGILDENGQVSRSLRGADLRTTGNPIDYFEQLIDLLYRMFTELNFVHGDYSPPNILVQDGELKIIDVLQSKRWTFSNAYENFLTYDDAFAIVSNDILSICKHFKQKYRLVIDVDAIIEEFRQMEF